MKEDTFGSKILKYQDDIIKDLGELIKIKSIAKIEGGTKEAPYGEEAAKALEWILNRAQEMGFKTKNVKNKAGHAEYGEGDDVFAIATHIDVVPATAGGWDTDPFELVEKDGVLYGRGVADDKGPALILLYAMKVLKEEGILGRYKLRSIFGCGEEIAADDLKTYFDYEKKPIVSFTPDAEYGICTAEKGVIRFNIKGDGIKNSIVKEIKGGEVINTVPKATKAVIECTNEEYENLIEISKKIDGKFYFDYNGEQLTIECIGKPAHAMSPELGINSILYLIDLLAKGFSSDKLGNFIQFIIEKFGTGYYGEKTNLKISDKQSGELTLCVSLINVNSKEAEIFIDIRYPVTYGKEYIIYELRESGNEFGLKTEELKDAYLPPIFSSKDSKLVTQLKEAYKNVTGEDATLYSMGGGTYARQLFNTGVGFGAVHDFEKNNIHKTNEKFIIKEFMLHAQICLEAMYKIFTEK